jgi:hypothetical protein
LRVVGRREPVTESSVYSVRLEIEVVSSWVTGESTGESIAGRLYSGVAEKKDKIHLRQEIFLLHDY